MLIISALVNMKKLFPQIESIFLFFCFIIVSKRKVFHNVE